MDGDMAAEREGLEERKLRLECKALEKDNNWLWRILQWLGMFVPAGAFLIAAFTLLETQYRKEDEELLSLLSSIGAKEEHMRLAAVSRLSVYETPSGLFTWFWRDPPIRARRQQIIEAVAAAISLEVNSGVKRTMFSLLERHGADAVAPLKRLRIHLIRELKQEQRGPDPRYWTNLRDTLFDIGITLSVLTKAPPDFRCFPLRGLRLRQYVLPDNANFTGATLAEAEFWGGTLRNAIFKDANLYSAIIKHVDVTGASFDNAMLLNATIGPDVDGLRPDAFRGADWWRAKWVRGQTQQFAQRLTKETPRRKLDDRSSFEKREAYCRSVLSKEFDVRL